MNKFESINNKLELSKIESMAVAELDILLDKTAGIFGADTGTQQTLINEIKALKEEIDKGVADVDDIPFKVDGFEESFISLESKAEAGFIDGLDKSSVAVEGVSGASDGNEESVSAVEDDVDNEDASGLVETTEKEPYEKQLNDLCSQSSASVKESVAYKNAKQILSWLKTKQKLNADLLEGVKDSLVLEMSKVVKTVEAKDDVDSTKKASADSSEDKLVDKKTEIVEDEQSNNTKDDTLVMSGEVGDKNNPDTWKLEPREGLEVVNNEELTLVPRPDLEEEQPTEGSEKQAESVIQKLNTLSVRLTEASNKARENGADKAALTKLAIVNRLVTDLLKETEDGKVSESEAEVKLAGLSDFLSTEDLSESDKESEETQVSKTEADEPEPIAERINNFLAKIDRDMSNIGEKHPNYQTRRKVLVSLRLKMAMLKSKVSEGVLTTAEAESKLTELMATLPVKKIPYYSKSVESNAAEQEEDEEQEKQEYLSLKRGFKEAEKEYQEAVKKDYYDRNILKKLAGLGREKMSEDVKIAHQNFLTANKAYFEYAQSHGIYEKIATRLKARNEHYSKESKEEGLSLSPLTAGRHVLGPMERRLQLQTISLQSEADGLRRRVGHDNYLAQGLEGLDARLVGIKRFFDRAKKTHPKIVGALGASALVTVSAFNLPGVVAGLTAHYAGGKLFTERAEKKRDAVREDASEVMTKAGSGSDLDIEALEKAYFATANKVHNIKTRTRAATISVVGATGGSWNTADLREAVGLGGGESVSIPEVGQSAIEETVEETYEGVHVDVGGEGMLETPDGMVESNSSVHEAVDDEYLPDSSTMESLQVAEASPFSSMEKHTVVTNDSMSKIVLDGMRKQLEAGNFKLPPGTDVDNLHHKVYQMFGEFTDAAGADTRFTEQQWKEFGVEMVDGKVNMIKLGSEVDIGAILEKINYTGDGLDVTPDVSIAPTPEAGIIDIELPPQNPIAEHMEGVSEAVTDQPSVPGLTDSPALPVDGIDNTMTLSGFGDADPEVRAQLDAIRSMDYTPRINENYLGMTAQFGGGDPGALHKHLAETIYEGFYREGIDLPREVANNVGLDGSNISSFVEDYLPSVNTNFVDSVGNFFTGTSAETSVGQWRDWGIASGNPRDIAPTDTVKVGEIINFVLGKAGEDVSSLQSEKMAELAASLPENLPEGVTKESGLFFDTYKTGGTMTTDGNGNTSFKKY